MAGETVPFDKTHHMNIERFDRELAVNQMNEAQMKIIWKRAPLFKPFIDKTYRTKPEREYTAMIGSSLGANIAQYIGLEHKDKVGALGIFSSANWLNKVEFDRYIAKHKLENQKVYIQVGTNEGDDTDRELTYGNIKQSYISTTLDYYRQLIEAGLSTKDIKLNVVADGEHSEECWAKYLPECLRFISEDW